MQAPVPNCRAQKDQQAERRHDAAPAWLCLGATSPGIDRRHDTPPDIADWQSPRAWGGGWCRVLGQCHHRPHGDRLSARCRSCRTS